MTRSKNIVAAVALVGACSPVLAQDTGFYVGGSLGEASFREVCRDFDSLVGVSGAFSCSSKQDGAGKLFAGWRFLRYLAAEVSYINYGEVKTQGTVGGATVTATSSVQAAGVSAVGSVPLGDRYWLLARLGLLQSKTSMRSTGAVTASQDHGETELHVGIGALAQLGRRWAMRVEYERLNDTRIDLSTLGVQYLF
jgi:hypothetical protein